MTSSLIKWGLLTFLIATFSSFAQDADLDGVLDSVDVDDDNDGITDNAEAFCTSRTWTATGTPNRAGQLTVGAGNPDDGSTGALVISEDNQTYTFEVTGKTFSGFDARFLSVGGAKPTSIATAIELKDGTIINNLDFNLYFSDSNGSNSGAVNNSHAHWGNIESSWSGALNYVNHVVKGSGAPFATGERFIQGVAHEKDQSWGDLNYIIPASVSADNGIKRIMFKIDGPGSSNIVAFFYIHGLPCTTLDTDKDGVPNRLDLDSDNDGISDLRESGQPANRDADNNGVLDVTTDTDNDGLANIVDTNNGGTAVTLLNSDGDSVANFIDLDSDNDGIPDTVELRATAGYVANDGNVTNDDSDGDGVIGLFDSNNGFGATFPVPQNTDGTDNDDYLDANSDNDAQNDSIESGFPPSADSNGDGIIDWVNASYSDPDGTINNPSTALANQLGTTVEVGYREVDPVTSKALTSESFTPANNIAEAGETLTYIITVNNTTNSIAAKNVVIRDSFLENLPSGVILNDPTASSGTLSTNSQGNYTLDSVAASASTTITYSITLPTADNAYDNLGSVIRNHVTDDNTTPVSNCSDADPDCVVINTNANPTTSKTLSNESISINGVAEAGEVLSYTISVDNSSSNNAAINVNIQDSLLQALPAGVTLSSPATASAGTLTTNSSGNYTLDSIAANSTTTISYKLTMPSLGPSYTNLSDTLANEVTDNGVAPSASCNNSATNCVVVNTNADPLTSKSLIGESSTPADGIAEAGETLTYQIKVDNSANDIAAIDVVITDSLLANLPTGMTFSTPSVDAGTLSPSGTNGVYILDRVDAKKTAIITYSVTFPTGANYLALGATVINKVTDDGTTPAATCLASDNDCVVVATNPITTVSKAIVEESLYTDSIAEPAEEITYQVTVTNPSTSNKAVNIDLRDSLLQSLPSGITLAMPPSADVGTITTKAPGHYLLNEVAAQSSVKVTYSVTMPELGDNYSALDVINNAITNDGSLPTCTADDLSNNLCVRIISEGTPSTTKTLSNESISVNGVAESGETLTYTISLFNNDSNPVASIIIKDSLLANLATGMTVSTPIAITSGSGSLNTIKAGEYEIVGPIPPGTTTQLRYSVTLPTNDPTDSADNYDALRGISNAVTDTGETPQPCPVTTATCTFTPKNAEPITSKAVTNESVAVDGIFEEGEVITYTITVDNTENATEAVNINLQDSLLLSPPPGVVPMSLADFTVSHGQLSEVSPGTPGNYNLDVVPAGTASTIKYTLTMPSGENFANLPNLLTNQVTDNGIAPDSGCSIIHNDCVGLTKSGEVTIAKDTSAESIGENHVGEEGEAITYTISLTNAGTTPAATVRIRDSLLADLPDGVTLTAAPTESAGTLTENAAGDYTLDIVKPGTTTTIHYTITLPTGSQYDALSQIVNAVTDDGTTPQPCSTHTQTCSIMPTNADPLTTKQLTNESIARDNVIEAGEVLSYSIKVDNRANNSDAVNVNIRDSFLANLPSGVTLSGLPTVNAGTLTTNSPGNYNIDVVAAKSVTTLTYSLTFPPLGKNYHDLPDTIINAVSDDGSQPPTSCAEAAENCVVVYKNADPNTSKTLSAESITRNNIAEAGETLTYSINVDNSGNSNAAVNINIRDSLLANLPTGASLVSGYPQASSGTLTTNSAGNYTLDKVAANAASTITYQIKLPPLGEDYNNLGNNLVNVVTDDGTTPTGSCSEGNNCVSTPLNAQPVTTKLLTQESNSNHIAEPGESLTYSISVHNVSTTNAAVNVNLRDSLLANLPTGVSLTAAPSVSPNPNGITLTTNSDGNYTLDKINAGTSATIVYTIKLPAAGENYNNLGASLANAVTDDGSTPPSSCNGTDANCATINRNATVSVSKALTQESRAKNGVAEAGETLTYVISVSNSDSIAAVNVPIKDSLLMNLPATITLTDPVVMPNTVTVSGSNGQFTLDAVAANSTTTLTYKLTMPNLGSDYDSLASTIYNAVTTDGSTPPTTCDNSATNCVVVKTNIDPVTSKALVNESIDKDGIAEAGETLTYQITVQNPDTDNAAANIYIHDSLLANLPAGMTATTPTVDSGMLSFSGSNGIYILDSVAANSSAVISYSVTFPTGANYLALGDNVINVVTDNGTTPDSTCLSTDNDCVVVATNPRTTISKAISLESIITDGIVEPEEEITYQISVTNPSTSNAAVNVNVRDSLLASLPSGMSVVSVPSINVGTLTTNSDGNYTIESIAADSTVVISYQLKMPTAGANYAALETLSNAVSNDGSLPTCSAADISANLCVQAVTEGTPNTTMALIGESISVNGIAEAGETLTYAIYLVNTEDNPVGSFTIKDSLLAALPDGVTLTSPLAISSGDGELTKVGDGEYSFVGPIAGKATTVLQYSITLPSNDITDSNDNFDKLGSIVNAVSDTGEAPVTCTATTATCTFTPKNVDPTTSKAVTNESIAVDGIFEEGEVITYTISVDNTASTTQAVNINLKDSLLLATPVGITAMDFADFTVSDGNLTEISSGTAGNYNLDVVAAGTTTTISYTLTMPNDASFDDLAERLNNHVTDNGSAPDSSCNGGEADCASLTKSGMVMISKAVSAESIALNHVAEEGEAITYTISLVNAGGTPAATINIRDSLLANLPIGVSLTSAPAIVAPATGELTTNSIGNYTLDIVPAESTTKINYTITLPSGANYAALTQIVNAVSDDGSAPSACSSQTDKCVILPTNVDPLTSKALTAESVARNNVGEAGETLTYTITVDNSGNSTDAVNINIKDSLLANLPTGVMLIGTPTVNPASVGLTTNSAGDFTLAKIAASSSATLVYSLKLPDLGAVYDALPATLINAVTDNGTAPATSCSGGSDCVSVNINAQPSTSKALSGESISRNNVGEPGEVLTYTVTIDNSANSNDAVNINLRDSLLANLPSGVSLSSPPSIASNSGTNTIAISTNSVGNYTLDKITAGSVATITYALTLPALGANYTALGSAIINGISDDGSVPPSSCGADKTDCVSVPTSAPVSVSKALSAESITANNIAEIGETLTYTLTITNASTTNAATHINVKDSLLANLPNGITLSTAPTVSPNSINLTTNSIGDYTLDSIAAESTATLTYSITLADLDNGYTALPASLLNSVTVDGSTPATSCAAERNDCVVVARSAVTTVSKQITSESINKDNIAEAGEAITYVISVVNADNVAAVNVPVKDSLLANLPGGISASAISVAPESITLTTNASGDYRLDSVPANSTATLTYTLTLPPLGSAYNDLADSLANQVSVDGTTPSSSCDSSAANCVVVNTNAAVSLGKSISAESIADNNVGEAGETLTYDIRITNSNAIAAVNVNIRDSLLENLPTGVSVSALPTVEPNSIGLTTNSSGNYTLDRIAANSSATLSYQLTLPNLGADYSNLGNVISNTASADGSDPAAISCGESTANCVSINTNAPTTVTKALTAESIEVDGTAQAGETLTYQLTVSNPSTANAAVNIHIYDSLLANLPSGMTATTPTVDNGTLTFSGTNGLYILDSIDKESTAVIRYQLRFPTGANYLALGDTVINVATADGSIPDNSCTNDDNDCVVVDSNPLTHISKAVDSESYYTDGIAEAEEEITYHITITNPNTSNDAVNINIRDSLLANLPAGISVVNAANVNIGTLTTNSAGNYTLERLAADSSAVISYTIKLPSAGSQYDALDIISNAVSNDGSLPTCSAADIANHLCVQVVSEGVPTTSKALTNETFVNGVAESGETLTYTITMANNDDSPAGSVILRDSLLTALPDGVTLSSPLVISAGSGTLKNISAGKYEVVGPIPANSTTTLQYSITLASNDPNNSNDDFDKLGNIVNAVTDTDEAPLPCTATNASCSFTPKNVDPTTSKAITNESIAVDGIFEEGEVITYTLTVDNTANSTDAVNINLKDSLLLAPPVGMTLMDFANFSVSQGTLSEITSGVAGNYNLDKVPAGVATTIRYTLTMPTADNFDSMASLLSNQVTDDGSTPSANCNVGGDDCVSLTKSGEVSISKAVTDESLGDNHVGEEGEVINYSIYITNADDTPAATINIQDSLLQNLPTGVILTTPPAIVLPNAGELTTNSQGNYSVDIIAANTTTEIAYAITLPSERDYAALTEIVNAVSSDVAPVACSSQTSSCIILPTNVDPVTTTAISAESGSIANVAEPGEVLTYSIRIDNSANATDAVNINIQDSLLQNLPAGVTASAIVPAPSSTVISTNSLGNYVIDKVAANSVVTLTYSITLPALDSGYSSLGNQISSAVSDNGSAPAGSCDSAPINSCVAINTNAQTTLTKTLESEDGNVTNVGEPGETLTYRLSIANDNTDNAALNVNVQDSLLKDLPDGVTLASVPTVSPSSILLSGYDGNYTLDSIPANSSATLSYALTLPALGSDYSNLGDSLGNQASSDGTTPTSNCQATAANCVVINTNAQPGIRIDLTNESGTISNIAEPGEALTYNISVNNTSMTNAAFNINVRDSLLANLPAGVELTSAPTVSPSSITLSGSDGNYVLDSIAANTTAIISYSVTLPSLGDNYTALGDFIRIEVTDNGELPNSNCDSSEANCTLINTNAQTITTIALTGESINTNDTAEVSETLTYTITVDNSANHNPALNVNIQDSLLQNLPAGVILTNPPTQKRNTLTVNNLSTLTLRDLTINSPGNFIIDSVPANGMVQIVYSITLPGAGEDYDNIGNALIVAITDDGSLPVSACDGQQQTCAIINKAERIHAISDSNGIEYTFTLNSATGLVGEDYELIRNDSLNGASIDPADISMRFISSSDANISINTITMQLQFNGRVLPGSYTAVYEICDITNAANCDQATIYINIISDLGLKRISTTNGWALLLMIFTLLLLAVSRNTNNKSKQNT